MYDVDADDGVPDDCAVPRSDETAQERSIASVELPHECGIRFPGTGVYKGVVEIRARLLLPGSEVSGGCGRFHVLQGDDYLGRSEVRCATGEVTFVALRVYHEVRPTAGGGDFRIVWYVETVVPVSAVVAELVCTDDAAKVRDGRGSRLAVRGVRTDFPDKPSVGRLPEPAGGSIVDLG